jgi:hypothetical protein
VNQYARVDAYKPENLGWTADVQSTSLENGVVRKRMQLRYEGDGYGVTENVTLYKGGTYLFVEAEHNATLMTLGFYGTPGGDESDDSTDSTVSGTVDSYDYRGVYDNVNSEGYELIIGRNYIDVSSWAEFKGQSRYGFDLNVTSSTFSYYVVAVTSGSSEIQSWPDRLLNPVTVVTGLVIEGPVCGDDVCEVSKGETESTCWDDCHVVVCGDGICEGDEDEETCPTDCFINVDIQQPYINQQYSLGDMLRVRAKATTPKGLDVLDATAVVYVPFDTPYSATLKDDGSHNDAFANDAVYGEETIIQPGAGVGLYNLTVNVTKWGGTSSANVQIEVRDALSTTAAVSNTTFYKGYEISVSGKVRSLRGVIRENATFEISFSSGSWRFTDTFQTDSSGEFIYIYPVSFAEPDGVWGIALGGNDSHGNRLNKTFEVEVITPSQILYYGVYFSTSPLSSYTRGDEIPVSVFVRKGDNPVENADVSYKDPAGNRRFLHEVTPGYYEDTYTFPMNSPIGPWTLAIQAIKYENNTLQAGASSPFTINITALQFVYDLIEPTRFVFVAGEPITLTISLRYANGTPVTGASVKTDSPSGEILIFDEGEVPGYYTRVYTPGNYENGSWSLNVLAKDSNENFVIIGKEILIRENIPLIPPWGWIIIAGVVLSSLIFWKVNGERRYYRWRFAKLNSEKERIETMKGIVEERYFNRRIDEETYTKLMRDYEEQSVGILSKLAAIQQKAKIRKKPKKKKTKRQPKEEKSPEKKAPSEQQGQEGTL